MRVVVTGGAGFVGSHLCERLVADGWQVVAVDNLDPFYAPAAKRRNLAALAGHPRFAWVEADVAELDATGGALAAAGFGRADAVVHLAAKAGVRPSIRDPLAYTRANVTGTASALELARRLGAGRFVFASSSSVYGNAARVPLREDDAAVEPISPYAATKRAGELLCHAYAHLHGLSVVCARLFTVYGPRQRPDLAIRKFAERMADGLPIPLFGDGSTARDYTYVDDVADGLARSLAFTAAHPGAFEVVNLGGSRTVTLLRLVELLAEAMGVAPEVEWLPPQPGDVERTFADVSRAGARLGWAPRVGLEEGIARFAAWLREERARAATEGGA